MTDPESHFPHPTVMPDGCVCDPASWFQPAVTSVCTSYKEDQNFPGCCANCEHGFFCHAEKASKPQA